MFVIKSGLGPVDHLLEDFGAPVALVSPEGVVFASNRPEWLFRLSRQPLSQTEMERLTESRQFADQPLQGLPGGLNLVAGFVTLDGERHGVMGAPVGIADSDGRSWQLLSAHNFQAAYPATLMLGVAAAIAAMTLILSLYLLGRHARAELEREASANREYLATTLNSIGEAVIAADTGGKVRHMNPVAEQLTGWSEAEALGRSLLEVFRIVNEETRAEVANPVDRVLREGMLVGLANHTLLIARDGTERPVAGSAAPIRNEKGATIGAVLVFRDQTEERAAENALRREKAAAQQYLDIAGVMMVALDASANVILVNQKGCAILGYPEKEILGRNWFEHFLPTRVREPVKSVFNQIMAGQVKPNEYVENHVLCRDGEERLIAWHNAVIRDEAGRIVGTLSSGEDITERRRAEEALGESEVRYRTLFERTANPVLVIDTDGNYVDANAAALEFLECTREELLMKNIKDFVPPGHDAETIPKLQALWAGGGRIEREYSVCGALKTLDLTITPGTWQGKRVVFGVGADITERKIAEEERLGLERKLQQALKAESLGRMAGAIAHHFNNLLGVVMGNLELAMDDLAPGAKPGVNLAEAMKATRRAAEVSGLMLSYLGQRPGDKQALDLVRTCSESLALLQHVPSRKGGAANRVLRRPAHRPGRCRPDQPDPHQPGHQRLRGHWGRGRRGAGGGGCGAGRRTPGSSGVSPGLGAGRRRLCVYRGLRYGMRHGCRGAGQDFRPVFLHQVHRPGPGTGRRRRDHPFPRGRRHRPERSRPGLHLQGPATPAPL